MDNRTLLDLSDEEFKTLINNYAERGADDFDLEADMFFDALADFMEELSEEVTLEVKGTWHNAQSRLNAHESSPGECAAQGIGTYGGGRACHRCRDIRRRRNENGQDSHHYCHRQRRRNRFGRFTAHL